MTYLMYTNAVQRLWSTLMLDVRRSISLQACLFLCVPPGNPTVRFLSSFVGCHAAAAGVDLQCSAREGNKELEC